MQQKQTKKREEVRTPSHITHQLSPAWIHKSFEDKIQKTHSCSKENSASQHVTALIFPIFPACVYLGVILHMHVPSLFLLRFCWLLLFQQPLYENNPGFSLNHCISVHSKYWECSNRYTTIWQVSNTIWFLNTVATGDPSMSTSKFQCSERIARAWKKHTPGWM